MKNKCPVGTFLFIYFLMRKKTHTPNAYPLSLVPYPIILPPLLKSDEMVGALAAILDYGVNMGMEATHNKATRKKLGPLIVLTSQKCWILSTERKAYFVQARLFDDVFVICIWT